MGRHSKDYDQEAQDKATSFDRQYAESQERAAGRDDSLLGQYEQRASSGEGER